MLSEEHRAMLYESAIDNDVIEARGYRTITSGEAQEYGFASWQCLGGLLLPLWGVDGSSKLPQLRPDYPRTSKKSGKSIKYETPLGATNFLDINPLMRSILHIPEAPIYITEGAKKGDALASIGVAALSLKGVFGWRGRTPEGQYTTLPDWEDIPIKNRAFVIAFDNDIYTNKMVNDALKRIRTWLLYKGASSAKVLHLPKHGTNKIGVDDYLYQMSGHPLDIARKVCEYDGRDSIGISDF